MMPAATPKYTPAMQKHQEELKALVHECDAKLFEAGHVYARFGDIVADEHVDDVMKIMHDNTQDQFRLRDAFEAQVQEDRAARKQAKKARKQAAAQGKADRVIYYKNRIRINQQWGESRKMMRRAKVEYAIIEALGSPPELLQNHVERYPSLHEGPDDWAGLDYDKDITQWRGRWPEAEFAIIAALGFPMELFQAHLAKYPDLYIDREYFA